MIITEMLFGGALALALLLALILTAPLRRWLVESGATRPNYRGELIPVGMGLIFIAVYYLVALLLGKWFSVSRGCYFLLGITLFALLGLIDDLLGSHGSRGLKGHSCALLQGRLTTGALKALGGGVGALLISTWTLNGRPWWEQLTAALLIALAANTLNLLDLRPGRAIKLFLIWGLVLGVVLQGRGSYFLLAPLLGSVVAYAPVDLQARGMLGDTGSNLLGSGLGMITVWNSTFTVQLALVLLLLLFHLYTEKYSLTEMIEHNRFWRFLDQLGRSDHDAREVH